ncbi:acyl-CoA synthetase [Lampropedia puyangensis]|uniref:Long-chain-fatty-acid--CoA ligase n=1 Tax=Lampropedia puyangensis TaxID=1330072 RepID=A0A4S8F575_9BURK|nr:AMP-binding protein [Lampropedia puyangensis]THU02578.1 acyl-CoA synthetase [Lampropedia puyangensis]
MPFLPLDIPHALRHCEWDLASFACSPADARRPIVTEDHGEASFTHADFVAHVKAWQPQLQSISQPNVALFEPHPGYFAASLWAIWHAGKMAILPGDTNQATRDALKALDCAHMGVHTHALRSLPNISEKINSEPDSIALEPLDLSRTKIGLFTSGSQGQPQLITKALRQLDAEVQTLESTFGPLLAVSPKEAKVQVWATVSHQHIYGLLFLVLWSLASGRTMGARRLLYPEDLVKQLNAPSILITTPAHLKRLDNDLCWSTVQNHLKAVFSSGGPLPFTAAQNTQRLLHQLPLEIFGSSETGGIAWRQSEQENAIWRTFDRVQWREHQGLLQLRSPNLVNDEWFETADRIRVVNQEYFELLGRADRIAKIEEKRVSLTAIEEQLLEHPMVQEAKVLVYPTAIGDRTAAVLVLKPSVSNDMPVTPPRTAQLFRKWLRNRIEPVAIPRLWRFVSAMPCNEQGKTTQHLLTQLFARSASQDANTRASSHETADSDLPHRPPP